MNGTASTVEFVQRIELASAVVAKEVNIAKKIDQQIKFKAGQVNAIVVFILMKEVLDRGKKGILIEVMALVQYFTYFLAMQKIDRDARRVRSFERTSLGTRFARGNQLEDERLVLRLELRDRRIGMAANDRESVHL